jgi:DNA-binding NtrC family response regulator
MRNSPIDNSSNILIACQDIPFGATVADFVRSAGHNVERCHDAQGVLRLTSLRDFEVLVLDLALDVESGMELLSFVRQRNASTRIILLFGIAQLERALEGVRHGAYFYLPLACPPSDVSAVVEKAVRSHAVQASMAAYEQNLFEELAGSSPGMQRVIELIRKVAPTDSTVLLLGESGTGKEVLANTLHRLSRRREAPFVAINCAALPDALLESELFGHVKGAFTGADRDKTGLFEEADNGTLFLDEIGDMSPITQAKLLRVLQTGEFRRVGHTANQHADVRILAATNRDLLEAVESHRFREDLYYRLNVIQIRIPPLRERMDAMPSLMAHFLQQANTRHDKQVQGMNDHALRLLSHYEFPGNVRELESIITHAVIMSDGPRIGAADLPEEVQRGITPRLALPQAFATALQSLSEVEEAHINATLDRLEGNQSKAAKVLGISRSTLWRKMREYQIER